MENCRIPLFKGIRLLSLKVNGLKEPCIDFLAEQPLNEVIDELISVQMSLKSLKLKSEQLRKVCVERLNEDGFKDDRQNLPPCQHRICTRRKNSEPRSPTWPSRCWYSRCLIRSTKFMPVTLALDSDPTYSGEPGSCRSPHGLR